MFRYVVLLALVPAIFATTGLNSCRNRAPRPAHVDIEGCTAAPCSVALGSTARMRVQFQAREYSFSTVTTLELNSWQSTLDSPWHCKLLANRTGRCAGHLGQLPAPRWLAGGLQLLSRRPTVSPEPGRGRGLRLPVPAGGQLSQDRRYRGIVRQRQPRPNQLHPSTTEGCLLNSGCDGASPMCCQYFCTWYK